MKHKISIFLALMTVLAMIWPVTLVKAQVPPDVINSYTVTVIPRTDGSLDIKYEFDYTATTDFPDNSAWLEIGVPNRNFQLTDFGPKDWVVGGNAKNGSQSQVHLDFAHLPRAKENFKFFFVIHQEAMANVSGEDVSFELTPAWFDFAEIKKLTIIWTVPADAALTKNLSPEPANRNGTTVTWTKEDLKANGKFTVSLLVAKSAFPDLKVAPTPLPATNNPAPSGGGISLLGWFLIVLAALVVVCLLVAWMNGAFDGDSSDDTTDYTRTATIGHSSPTSSHDDYTPTHRSTCACVSTPSCVSSPSRSSGGSSSYSGRSSSCVSTPSCACACACAGSGRAGCSEKGFGIKRLFTRG